MTTIEIKARDFGAVPDDGTDQLAALRRVSRFAESAAAQGFSPRVILEQGTYLVEQHATGHAFVVDPATGRAPWVDGPLCFEGVDGLVIEGNGARIEHPGGYTTAMAHDPDDPSQGWAYPYAGLHLLRCHDAEVRDLTLVGGADHLVRGTLGVDGALHPELWSHGMVLYACDGVLIERVQCEAWPSDGFFLDATTDPGRALPETMVTTKHVQLRECTAIRNGRLGMAVADAHAVTVEDSVFCETGTAAYGGHSPGYGVDIEPDQVYGQPAAGQYDLDAEPGSHRFERVICEDNTLGSFVSYYQRVKGLELVDCRFVHGTAGNEYAFQAASPGTIMRGCYVEAKRPLIGCNTDSGSDEKSVFEDNEFRIVGEAGFRALDLGGRGARFNVVFRRNLVFGAAASAAVADQLDAGSVSERNVFVARGGYWAAATIYFPGALRSRDAYLSEAPQAYVNILAGAPVPSEPILASNVSLKEPA